MLQFMSRTLLVILYVPQIAAPGTLKFPRRGRTNDQCELDGTYVVRQINNGDIAECRREGGSGCCNCLFHNELRALQYRAELEWARDQAQPPNLRGKRRKNGRAPRALAPKPIHINWSQVDIFEADGATQGQDAPDGRMSFWVVCAIVLSIPDYTTLQKHDYWGKYDLVAAIPRVSLPIRIKCARNEKIDWRPSDSRRQYTALKADGTLADSKVLDAACVPATTEEFNRHVNYHFKARSLERSRAYEREDQAVKKRLKVLAGTRAPIQPGSSSTCLEIPKLSGVALEDSLSERESSSTQWQVPPTTLDSSLQQSENLVMITSIIPSDTTLDVNAIGWPVREALAIADGFETPWISDFDLLTEEIYSGQAALAQDIRLLAQSVPGPGPMYIPDTLVKTGPANFLAVTTETWPALFTQQDVPGPLSRSDPLQPSSDSGFITCVTTNVGPDMDLYNQLLQIVGPESD